MAGGTIQVTWTDRNGSNLSDDADLGTLQQVQEVFGRGGALKSSWYGDCLPSRDFPMLVDLHLDGRLPLEKFVSETIGLGDVEEAFAKMERGEVLRSVVVF